MSELPSKAVKTKIVVLCSGNGTNLQALIDACEKGDIPGEITKVYVNRKSAFAVQRAANHGIPSTYFNMLADGFHKKGESDPQTLRKAREAYDAALAQTIIEDKPELIVLAGWMHVFTPSFLHPLDLAGTPIINLHPALPGKYDGAGAIERAYDDFQNGKLDGNKTGIMVHYVIAEVDRGEPILVKEIECKEGESLEDFTNRIHSHEHDLIVSATAKIAREIQNKKLKELA